RHEGAVAVSQGSSARIGASWFRGGKAAQSREDAALQEQDGSPEAILKDLRRLSHETSQAESSLPPCRASVAAAGLERRVMLEYARFLIRITRGSTAEEVLALSLASNAAQVAALELYLELVRELDLPGQRSTWALSRLSEDIPAHPAEHRAALDYAIPHRLTAVFDAVLAGNDAVSRAIVQIDQAYRDQSISDAVLASIRSDAGLGEN